MTIRKRTLNNTASADIQQKILAEETKKLGIQFKNEPKAVLAHVIMQTLKPVKSFSASHLGLKTKEFTLLKTKAKNYAEVIEAFNSWEKNKTQRKAVLLNRKLNVFKIHIDELSMSEDAKKELAIYTIAKKPEMYKKVLLNK